MDENASNGHSSDRENDAFEDAPDMAPSPSRPRSLTSRRPSQTSSASKRDADTVQLPAVPAHDAAAASAPADDEKKEDNATVEAEPPKENEPPKEDDPPKEIDLPKETDLPKEIDTPKENDPPAAKSPLLTSHRVSVSSETMDDVSLDGEQGKKSAHSRSSTMASNPPTAAARDSNSSMQGLSGNLPAIQHPPPPPPPEKKQIEQHPPAPPPRKLTSPFSWLSRATTSEKKTTSPPLPAKSESGRRGTNASVATIGSNPELMLSRIDGGDENSGPNSARSSRNSLKDRFKFLRMREEAGIPMEEDEDGAAARSSSVSGGLGSPTKEDEPYVLPPMTRALSSPGAASQPTVNPNLAPGTASGFAVGPVESAPPVDWDLWQSVVYEGPAAVARTSAEELNAAIASGIPQAIRGVVWQVLAQSKNEELEGVYRELVARGTDKERMSLNLPHLNRSESSSNVNGYTKEKDSVTSSASSVHSDSSTPATTATTGVMSPTQNGAHDPESIAAVQAKVLEERKKKAKEDAANLSKLEKAIKRDLGARTSYSKFVMAAGLQDGLFGVCKAYALFDEAVGYAQGMNFIAMPLLFNVSLIRLSCSSKSIIDSPEVTMFSSFLRDRRMLGTIFDGTLTMDQMPEEEAFCMLVRLMNKYGLREMFIQDMPGLHLHLYQFERLLEDFEPALYCHLHRRGVSPQLYATQWFLTLFAYRFPLQLVLRIYDLILSEGIEGAILKFGIVLMQKNAKTLLEMKDMAALTTFLKERIFDVYIDKAPSASSLLESGFFGSAGGVDKEVYRADILVQDACAIKITPEMLKQYTEEWREQQRLDKDRETELEHLKSSVASLSSKVRVLEERAEKSDKEHVAIASDLVRTKVENENLQDQNESLTVQVEELRKVVERQPDEVEARLKHEMETVMQRNIEVHNENRALEEQLADIERVLVETKMAHAQVDSDHETLKQKWSSIQSMLNSQ